MQFLEIKLLTIDYGLPTTNFPLTIHAGFSAIRRQNDTLRQNTVVGRPILI
jgi:hypothetical protein